MFEVWLLKYEINLKFFCQLSAMRNALYILIANMLDL